METLNKSKKSKLIYNSEWGYDVNGEYYSELDGEFFYDMTETLLEMHDSRREATISGSLGLWDGVHRIRKEKVSDFMEAYRKCTDIRGDYMVKVYKNGDHTITISVTHHDGTNTFKVTEYL